MVFHWSMDAPAAADSTTAADAALAARLATDLDGSFEELVPSPGRTGCSRSRCAVLGDRGDAGEARPGRARPGVSGAQRLSSREDPRARGSGRWLTTIVVNVCRNRTRVRRVVTTELAFEPGAQSRPPIPSRRRDVREAWASLLATLRPGPADRRSSSATSTACRTPRWPRRLGRPEGTVKAHVHRGLADCSTAPSPTSGHEREEMTA